MIVDYSQYSRFNFCPWSWFENYVNQRALQVQGQRSDPLCLGSLVHNALDNFSKTGKPVVDAGTLLENTPTPETVQLAELLVLGYLKKYPKEAWPVDETEAPLRFPLEPDYPYSEGGSGFEALAKLDGYFYVPEDTTVESGIPGQTLTLSRGWWGREYKTKARGRSRPEWIKEWQTKRQADFQILALKHYLEQQQFPDCRGTDHVQGIMVCVLEKPHEYTPMRKCAGCKESFELSLYQARAEGYACPMCGAVQKLSPYVPKVPKVPEYFRITVTRTTEQLETARQEILDTALDMDRMVREGMTSVRPNRDACVHNIHRRECEYFGPHTYGGTTKSDVRYVQIEATKYMGLGVEVA